MKIRSFPATLIAGAFTTLLLCAAIASADDWPQYRGIAGDGKSPETIKKPDWPNNGPKVLWKRDTPLGFSSFSVANGRAFTLVSVDGHENVLALNADTGDQLWTVKLGESDYNHDGGNSGAPGNRGGDGPRPTPSTDGERVFVYDAHLLLSCFDAKSGQVIWKQDIASDFDGRNIKWFNAVSPLLSGNVIYVPGGGAGQSLLAFNKNNGELLWKSSDETMTHATPTLATIHNQQQLIHFAKSGLVAVDAQTGAENWRSKFPFSVSTAASPIVSKDMVYCSAGYGVGAGLFKIGSDNSVDEVWYQPNKLMNHWSTPVAHDGHLYGLFEFKKYGKAPLQCVEISTGKIKWSERGFGPGNCILVGDKLVVLSDAGHLVLAKADPNSYQQLAKAKVIDGKCWSTPAFSNGRVYIRSTKEGACVDLN